MQAMISVKCRYCDILLEGKEQSIGHMVHSHETSIVQAEAEWKSAVRQELIHNVH